jgi:hypothetical protein
VLFGVACTPAVWVPTHLLPCLQGGRVSFLVSVHGFSLSYVLHPNLIFSILHFAIMPTSRGHKGVGHQRWRSGRREVVQKHHRTAEWRKCLRRRRWHRGASRRRGEGHSRPRGGTEEALWLHQLHRRTGGDHHVDPQRPRHARRAAHWRRQVSVLPAAEPVAHLRRGHCSLSVDCVDEGAHPNSARHDPTNDMHTTRTPHDTHTHTISAESR